MFFYRKILIIFFSQFFQWKIEVKALAILLILSISLWEQAKENPYITDDLNALDFKATLFSFCTIFTGFFSYEADNSIVEAIVLIFVFLMNIYFIFIWIKKMLILKITFIKSYKSGKYLKYCTKCIEKLEPG